MKAMNYTVENLTPYDNVDVKRFDALDEDDYDSLAEEYTEKFDYSDGKLTVICGSFYMLKELLEKI